MTTDQPKFELCRNCGGTPSLLLRRHTVGHGAVEDEVLLRCPCGLGASADGYLGTPIEQRKASVIDTWNRSQRPSRGVLQPWVQELSLMQQTVLLTAIRGPDGMPKYGGVKMLLRWFRRCVLFSALDGVVLPTPCYAGGGSFTGPSCEVVEEKHWSESMQAHVDDYLRNVDAMPHHFQMHFLHAAEILGYKHPDAVTRLFWFGVYRRLVNDFHLHMETEQELDSRLGDTREGWLKHADPATIA